MRLEQSFEVPVPIAQAWGVLLDVEKIAPCMPGATLTGFDGTGFTGLVKVKLGPVVMSYRGNGRFVERDESAHRVVIVASGQETKGAGGAQARVTAVLHPDRGGESTQVKVVADVDIAGRAAQFGRGMIADVSRKLVQQFADCLAQTIATQPAAPPAAPPAPGAADAAPATPAPTSPAPTSPAPAAAAPVPASADAAPPAGAGALGVAPAAEEAPAAAEASAPSPTPAAPPVGSAAAPPAEPAPLASPIEGQPIDLLAVSGAKGMVRRLAPAIAIVIIILLAIIVFLALS